MLATVRRSVGSRTGAYTLGSGGTSTAFAMDRIPSTVVTFPVPAASNAACGFAALRSPACFMSGIMRPIVPGLLSIVVPVAGLGSC
jgi:hypothetical protein